MDYGGFKILLKGEKLKIVKTEKSKTNGNRNEYHRERRARIKLEKEKAKQEQMGTVTPITPQTNSEQVQPLQQPPHTLTSNTPNTVTNSANIAQHKTLDTRRCFLVFLILCGSIFLVTEQVQFYTSLGYKFAHSVFLALLLETTPIALAYFAGVTNDRRLYYAIFPAVICIGAVIYLGLSTRLEKSENTAKISTIFEEQLTTLKEEAKDADGKALKKIEEKISKKQDELTKQLSQPQSQDTEWQLWVLAFIRFLALCYNLMFARLLAVLK